MPRHYMIAYFEANKDKDKERKALEGCPKEFQELVKKHIEIRRERERWQIGRLETK